VVSIVVSSALRHSGLRRNVLVHMEQIGRIVLRLDLRQSGIVAAIGRTDQVRSLMHGHVQLGATGSIGMQRQPVVLGPLHHLRVVGWVGIDRDDHFREGGVTGPASSRLLVTC